MNWFQQLGHYLRATLFPVQSVDGAKRVTGKEQEDELFERSRDQPVMVFKYSPS